MRARAMNTALTLLILLSPAASRAGRFPAPRVEFSGDTRTEAMGMIMTGKVYAGKGKQRLEMQSQQMGMSTITILRPDKNVGWTLLPEQKTYMEVNLTEQQRQSGDFGECAFDSTAKGSEKVNGVSATRSHGVVKCPDAEFEGDFWVSPDGITVKMDVTGKTKDGQPLAIRQEVSNLKIGPQDSALFEIPAGYASMGNLQQMARDAQLQMEAATKQMELDSKKRAEEVAKREAEEAKRAGEEEARKKKEEAAREYSERKRNQAVTAPGGVPSTVEDAVKSGIKKLFKW